MKWQIQLQYICGHIISVCNSERIIKIRQYLPQLCSNEQELSYRKQIARQLRTQYVEGIYRSKYYTVILKSRLRVTLGHWKRNRWIDRTRLTISRVIWR